MEYIEKITNIHFRKLIKKSRKLNKNIIDEFKRCILIQHVLDNGDGTYSVCYSEYGDKKVLYFFTDLDEYHKCYPAEKNNTRPEWCYLVQIEDFLYKDTCGIIINPKSENFFIPQDVLWHIIQDEIVIQKGLYHNLKFYMEDFLDRNKIYTAEELLDIENKRSNDSLIKYVGNKKRLTNYTTLFDYFKYSYLYAIIQFDEELDFKGDYFEPNMIEYTKEIIIL